MGGYSANKQPRSFDPEHQTRRSSDPCDFEIRVDLVGVRPQITAGLESNQILDVEIREHRDAKSVVCVTTRGEVAGTLAAFRGLARLIGCLDQGQRYFAVVENSSATRCAVLVQREHL